MNKMLIGIAVLAISSQCFANTQNVKYRTGGYLYNNTITIINKTDNPEYIVSHLAGNLDEHGLPYAVRCLSPIAPSKYQWVTIHLDGMPTVRVQGVIIPGHKQVKLTYHSNDANCQNELDIADSLAVYRQNPNTTDRVSNDLNFEFYDQGHKAIQFSADIFVNPTNIAVDGEQSTISVS